MTEIPEHLRKRAEEARAKAAAASGAPADAPAAGGDAAPPSDAESKIPAHLLERSKADDRHGGVHACPPGRLTGAA